MIRLRATIVLVGCLLGVVAPVAGASAAGARQTGLPAGWKRLVWQGIVISYNPSKYRFEPTKPDNPRGRAAAHIIESPNPCQSVPQGEDCIPGRVTLQLYPNRSGDVRAWMAANGSQVFPGFSNEFTDTVIGGRQAIQFVVDLGIGGALTAYAVPTGSDMLVMTTHVADERLVSLLQFSRPATDRLAAGQVAMTKAGRAWDLWTAPTGGKRVDERPKLLGGAFLVILAIRPQAVQVRTTEGVTGWIRAAAPTALTTRPALPSEHTRFGVYWAQVVAPNGLILRQAPQSSAPKVVTVPKAVDRLERGQPVLVLGRRGDWLRVLLNGNEANGFGWLRWHYDGARYIEVALD